MRALRIALLAVAGYGAGFALAPLPAHADPGAASPARMVRSLQFVQDAVVQGDHSAMDMQSHLLGLIDQRLRGADPTVFAERANVDAAFIYTMSGGNPATLAYLAENDAEGRFDPPLVAALALYLGGRNEAARGPLLALLPEYRTRRLGPYLALVAGNVTAARDVPAALHLFDWVRLLAPGTILEEAALRRSIFIAGRAGQVEQGLDYAERYARRFLNSPYASQFADMFVDLVMAHPDDIDGEQIAATLDFMDPARQQAIYLRIARQAAIGGKRDLAQLAAARARGLATDGDSEALALSGLYSGLASVPTDQVTAAFDAISDIPNGALAPRDIALREAARRIAEEVLRKPVSDGAVAQANRPVIDFDGAAEPDDTATPADLVAAPVADEVDTETAELPAPVASAAVETAQQDGPQELGPELQTYMQERRAVLDAVNSLLEETR
jgi:chemotaxis protein MotC